MKSVMLIILLAVAYKASADAICGKDTGSLIPHVECNKFYLCNHGIANLLQCPNNLYFDGAGCTYRENVPECQSGTRAPPTESEEPVVDPIPDEPVVPAPEDPVVPVEPQPEDPTPVEPVEPVDPVEPTPVDPEPEQPAPVDPVVPNPGDIQCPADRAFFYITVLSDPNLFYICQNGVLQGVSNCSFNLVFSQALQACIPPL